MKQLKNTRPVILLVPLLILLVACERDEVLLTGEITGVVYAKDENGYSVSPEGIPVILENDSLSFREITGSDGWYLFEEIPIGNYNVRLEKEGYVVSEPHPFIQHIGGYSPTKMNFSLSEVPKLSIQVDSVKIYDFNEYSDDFTFYGSFINSSREPQNGYYIWIFVHLSSDVSPSNNSRALTGYIWERYITGQNFQFPASIDRFYQPGDTIYFRICPVASVSDWYTWRYETMGPLSEVFEWVAEWE
jgi:hypothetical protein